MQIDKLIELLEISRDNGCRTVRVEITNERGAARESVNLVSPWIEDSVIVGHRPTAYPTTTFNHTAVHDARISDDLRKLIHYHANFRKACVEFANARNLKHDPNDPDRFRRLRKQVIETGRDIVLCIGHIEPEAGR